MFWLISLERNCCSQLRSHQPIVCVVFRLLVKQSWGEDWFSRTTVVWPRPHQLPQLLEGRSAQLLAQLHGPRDMHQRSIINNSNMPFYSVVCRTSWIANTHTHPFNGPFSGTTRVSRYQKGKTNLDFTEARQWVAVASAGPYASLHLAPDKQAHQHPTTVFYRPDALPAAQPTASKHWRQTLESNASAGCCSACCLCSSLSYRWTGSVMFSSYPSISACVCS